MENTGAKFWIAIAFAILGSTLLVLTMANPEWIEEVFKVEPDEGSGSLELAISIALLVIAVVSAWFAGFEFRRPAR